MYLIKRILALWLFMGPTVRALFLYPFPHTHAFTLRLILFYLIYYFFLTHSVLIFGNIDSKFLIILLFSQTVEAQHRCDKH